MTACGVERDISKAVTEELGFKYDTTFEVTKQYKATKTEKDEVVQKGIAKSKEGYYVDFQYNFNTDTLTDNYETAKFNGDTSKAIGQFASLQEGDYILHSYVNQNNTLEVVIALRDGTTYDPKEMQNIANSYLSPIAEISVYTLSRITFESLKKDFEVKGTVTNDTIKGYLILDKATYTSPFDVNKCFEDSKLETSDRCQNYIKALSGTEQTELPEEVIEEVTPEETTSNE